MLLRGSLLLCKESDDGLGRCLGIRLPQPAPGGRPVFKTVAFPALRTEISPSAPAFDKEDARVRSSTFALAFPIQRGGWR